MSFKIATPISHLFEDLKNAKLIIEHSDCLECRDRSINTDFSNQEVFHCHLQPTHELDKNDFNYLSQIAQKKPDLNLISFHVASACKDPLIENGMFQLNGKVYSKKDMMCNFKNNLKQMHSLFDKNVKIAIENTNYYPTDAYKDITDASFIDELVCENEIYFLYDISHGKITCHNQNIDYEFYINSLPLHRAIQLHISGFSIKDNNLAWDTHAQPEKAEWEKVKLLVEKYNNIKYITIEYYQEADKLINSLKIARELINDLSG